MTDRSEIVLSEQADRVEKLSTLYLQGNTNPTHLAKLTGLKRMDVVYAIEQWRQIMLNDEGVKERAKEAVWAMDAHFAMLIKELWSIINVPTDDKVKISAIKEVGILESKRIELLQKAGLISDSDTYDKIAETEEKLEIMTKILKDVCCNDCRVAVIKQLQKISGQTEEVVMKDEE